MTGQTPPPNAGTPAIPDATGTPIPTMTGKRVLVIFNPKSGDGNSGLPEFNGLLRDAGADVTERELTPERPMSEYVQDVESFDAVVAAGGDGTVSSVSYASRYKNVPLLAYPAGTANLIAQNLNLPATPLELARIVATGHAVRVDLGEVEVRGEKKGFAMLTGTGADAAMIRDSEDLKDKFGAFAYVMSAMKQISPKKTTFTLTVDGQKREFEGIGVMVANFGMANFRLPITTDISPSDGRFTVILMQAGNLLQLVPNLIDSVRSKLNLGDPLFKGNLETIEAKEITVEAADPFPLQYDGEMHEETTPFTARVLAGAVRYLTASTEEELAT